MTDVSNLIILLAQGALLLTHTVTVGRASPAFKAFLIAGNLTVLVFIGATLFGGMKIEVPVNRTGTALCYAVGIAMLIVSIKVMIDPRGPWSRRER